MDFVDLVDITWKTSKNKAPNVLFLICSNKLYVVSEDEGSIITVVSKTDVVYAIAKSKVIETKIDGVKFYYLEDTRDMRVISCTISTNKNVIQLFVIKNITKYIKNIKFDRDSGFS